MPDQYSDQSGNTEAFRVFAERDEPAGPARRTALIVGLAVVSVIVLAAVIWLAAA
jgi:hypothetical protein